MSDAERNPYDAPLDHLATEAADAIDDGPADDDGIWRDDDLLIVRIGSALPPRCVKCNAPAVRWKKQSLYWHHSNLYFLLPLGVAVYLIVMLMVRRHVLLSVGVCQRHLDRRSRIMSVALLMTTSGLVAIILAACLVGSTHRGFSLPIFLSGVAFVIVGVLYGMLGSRLLRAKRIDPIFAWIKGASLEYLAELPEFALSSDEDSVSE
jgi:hypothetical protein